MSAKTKTVLFVLSVLILAGLLVGCFGTVGVNIDRIFAMSNGSGMQTINIGLDAGRVRITTQSGTLSNGVVAPRTSVRWERWRPRLPDMKRMIWEFDAHPLALPSGQVFLLAFPIWVAAIPFLVVLIIYIRRRMKNRREPAGFAVVSAVK